MAIVMALLSGFAGVYTEAIIKKRPSRNINVQNFWLYIFGMGFNAIAILVQDFDAVVNKGFFHGYSFITFLMIINHALSGIAVSMVMKYADNIVKVYSTSVAMLLTAVVSVFLFGFHLSLAFFLGTIQFIAYSIPCTGRAFQLMLEQHDLGVIYGAQEHKLHHNGVATRRGGTMVSGGGSKNGCDEDRFLKQ
ncbi:CMP-sialic acid transporter 2, variant 2 [Lathyrus oleraceus]|nr:CMP-sialic acid transporter 2, variant 2 [Pisum sativum]